MTSKCIKDYYNKDGLIFKSGQYYAHLQTKEINIQGINSVVVQFSKENFKTYFK